MRRDTSTVVMRGSKKGVCLKRLSRPRRLFALAGGELLGALLLVLRNFVDGLGTHDATTPGLAELNTTIRAGNTTQRPERERG